MAFLSLFEPTPAARSAARPEDYGLRPYQCEAFDAIVDGWADRIRSQLIVMATGLGKTQLFCALAGREVDEGGRALIVAHRTELIEQAAHRARDMVGCLVGIEQAGRAADNERIVVASVQTLGVNEIRRQARFKDDPPTLVVIDEAHHAIAESYRSLLESWPEARIIGVTATPDRGDGLAMGQVFEKVAYVRDIETGIADGYLAPIVARQFILKEVDLSEVKITGGDLNLAQVDKEMVKANLSVAKTCLEECGDRLTIVFSTKVETAHDLAKMFNRFGRGDIARAVDAKTDPDERRQILKSHARREFQFLINVGIATEGYDCPDVSCVAIARPTKSRALYTQMGGRGLRPLAYALKGMEHEPAETRRAAIDWSPKPDCLLLDFSGNSGKHDLACPLDLILDGRELTDSERRALREKMQSERGASINSKAEARAVIEAERAARAAAQARYDGMVKGRIVERNPFKKSRDDDAHQGIDGGSVPVTAFQREYLKGFGVPPGKIPPTKEAAGKMLGRLADRRKKGFCTYKQAQVLNSHGINTDKVTVRQASQVIDYMEKHGWGTPPLEFLNSIVGWREVGQEG